MSNELAEQQLGIAVTGARDLTQAIEAQKQLNNFIASQMREGIDYGVIPGTKKKSLLKPGTEKLLFFNGLGIRLEPTTGTIVNWDKPFFNYEFRAIVFHKRSGTVVAECIGSANSLETKYRYIWVKEYRIPRGLDKDSLETKEKDGDTLYRIDNPDIYNLPNTLNRMAQKRAISGGAILACRASENFTTEIDDDDIAHPATLVQDLTKMVDGEAKPAPAKPASNNASKPAISEAQVKRVYTIMKSAGVDIADVKEYLKAKLSYTVDEAGESHLARVSWKDKDYENLCTWIAAGVAEN